MKEGVSCDPRTPSFRQALRREGPNTEVDLSGTLRLCPLTDPSMDGDVDDRPQAAISRL